MTPPAGYATSPVLGLCARLLLPLEVIPITLSRAMFVVVFAAFFLFSTTFRPFIITRSGGLVSLCGYNVLGRCLQRLYSVEVRPHES